MKRRRPPVLVDGCARTDLSTDTPAIHDLKLACLNRFASRSAKPQCSVWDIRFRGRLTDGNNDMGEFPPPGVRLVLTAASVYLCLLVGNVGGSLPSPSTTPTGEYYMSLAPTPFGDSFQRGTSRDKFNCTAALDTDSRPATVVT